MGSTLELISSARSAIRQGTTFENWNETYSELSLGEVWAIASHVVNVWERDAYNEGMRVGYDKGFQDGIIATEGRVF